MPVPSGKTQTHFEVPLSLMEARMNSKAAQLTENGIEIVCLFARFALGASFLSAVADRFGLWGPYGAKNVLVINKIDLAPLVGANSRHWQWPQGTCVAQASLMLLSLPKLDKPQCKWRRTYDRKAEQT